MPGADQAKSQGAGYRRGTLAAVLGSAAAAAALFVSVPADESGRVVEAAIAADGSATVKHISGKQQLKSYKDIVGIETACDGIAYVKPGTYSEAQCAAMLERELVKHAAAVMDCTPGLHKPGADNQRIAATSLAYNIGPVAYCKSTARRLFNAGDYRGGCLAILRFNRAGGRVVKGLVNRRHREVYGHQVGKTFVPGCLTGLPS